jgi:hypothetical protein
MKRAFIAIALGLTACASAPSSAQADDLEWISGCWRNDDRTYKEVWTKPEAGYLFGYALNLEGDTATFFEQTRIELGTPATFNAYPGGFGPSEFTETSRGKNTVTFANPAHDFPQVISYTRDGRRMTATISRMDGSQSQVFSFRRC